MLSKIRPKYFPIISQTIVCRFHLFVFLLRSIQSVGKSLTLRGAALEATELLKTHRCKDPICDTHLWKVKHELDMARMKMKSLEEQLQSKGIQSPLLKNSFESGVDSKNSSCEDIDHKQSLLEHHTQTTSVAPQGYNKTKT